MTPRESSPSAVYRLLRQAPILPAIVAFLVTASACMANTRPPAFPGAEGYGKYATGGTRLPEGLTRPVPITVHKVTNLNDSGPGSFRAAVSASGPRVVIFEVSGTIHLQSNLNITNSYITIAGQTAPGDGICITGYPFAVHASNVVIRFLRMRLGDANNQEADAFGIASGYNNIIIDHCSVSFGVDETFSFYAVSNVTVQWTIISESLYRSVHDKGTHGYGSLLGGVGVSFHHNLYAHHTSRTPRFNGGRAGTAGTELVDFRNNVIYNWGFNGAHGGEVGARINVVNNYYKYGPATSGDQRRYRIVEPTSDRLMSGQILLDENNQPYHSSQWFVEGNFVDGFPSVTADNWAGGVQGSFAGDPDIRSDEPFEVAFALPGFSALEAYQRVLLHAGAVLPARDPIDRRILDETRTGTAAYGATYGAGRGIIDTPDDVGGFPPLRSLPAPPDSDGDGIPDDWETVWGLDPHSAADAHRIEHPSGYSHLERYLNALAAPGMPGDGAQVMPHTADRMAAQSLPLEPEAMHGHGFHWSGEWRGHAHPDIGEFVRLGESGWIYSLAQARWLYPVAVAPTEFLFYDPASGDWLWTAMGLRGWFWSRAAQQWLQAAPIGAQ
jgi:pectate lyase